MPNGRAIAETLQIGDVVGEVAITVTEAMVDAYGTATAFLTDEQETGECE